MIASNNINIARHVHMILSRELAWLAQHSLVVLYIVVAVVLAELSKIHPLYLFLLVGYPYCTRRCVTNRVRQFVPVYGSQRWNHLQAKLSI